MHISKISSRGFLLLNFVSSASISAAIITPALPRLDQFYSLHTGQLEWVMTIFLIGYMMGQIIYGPLSDRLGRINSLRIGLGFHLIGIIVCFEGYLSQNFSILILGRFLAAIGSASGLVCAFTLIHESLEHSDAKSTFAYTSLSFGLAATLSIFFGGLITQWVGWQYCFIFLFLHTLVLMFLTMKLPETYPKEMRIKKKEPEKDIKVSSNNFKKLISFASISGLNVALIYTYTTAAPLISKSYLGLFPSVYGFWNLINVIGMVLGGISAATLINRLGGMQMIRNGLLILSAVFISFLLIEVLNIKSSLWFFITSSVMYFGGAWIFSSAAFYASNAIQNKALGSAVMSFINLLSAVVALIVLGYLPFKYLVSFIIVAAIFMTVGFFAFTSLRKQIKHKTK